MTLSNDDRARLATELCGLERWECKAGDLYMQGEKGPFVCDVVDFDPLANGSHPLLVLEGLVKKTMEKFTAYTKDKACRIILHQLATMPEMPEDNWLGNLVCAAGLEVLKQKGGK